MVMDDVPVSVAFAASRNALGLLLEIVTGTALEATVLSPIEVKFSRPLPTFTGLAINPEAVTLPVRVAYCDGALNPDGTLTVKEVLPTAIALNWTVPVDTPPVKTTGDFVIVPTDVVELVTLTDAVTPPATCCAATNFSDESSWAAVIVTAVLTPGLVDKVDVVNPLGPAITNPDGDKDTVAVPLL
jgi:hypothetical protein